MKKIKLTAHCLVRNEEKWIWYAIKSVLDYVDKIIIFDTGSTDNTVHIIKSIKSHKIIFEEKGKVNKQEFACLRQEMLDLTKTEWFMVLDGDEIWPRRTITELTSSIQNAPKKKSAIIVGQWICKGDIFHYDQQVEELQLPELPKNMKGFRLARAIKKTKGLHCIGVYGNESYANNNNVNISYWKKDRLIFIKNKILHMSFLPRSSNSLKDRGVMMRAYKTRFQKGKKFANDFTHPEVFYLKRPDIVPTPWRKHTYVDEIKGYFFRTVNFISRSLD